MKLPARIESDGYFPFGRPNTPRDVTWRGSGSPRLLVVGVYPSALHVKWSAPAAIPSPDGAKGRISAMAVDVEPEVFWRGDHAEAKVEQWKREVGFVEGDEPRCDGSASAHGNGPSGRTLDSYLEALKIESDATAYVDVHPVFVVHQSSGSQGAAVKRDYDPVVESLAPGRVKSSLPPRPTATALPQLAAERFGSWLVEQILELQPDLIVTLGTEPWAGLTQMPGVITHHDANSLSATKSMYGREGTLAVVDRAIPWVPLAHPGLLEKSAEWRHVHDTWAEQQRDA